MKQEALPLWGQGRKSRTDYLIRIGQMRLSQNGDALRVSLFYNLVLMFFEIFFDGQANYLALASE